MRPQKLTGRIIEILKDGGETIFEIVVNSREPLNPGEESAPRLLFNLVHSYMMGEEEKCT